MAKDLVLDLKAYAISRRPNQTDIYALINGAHTGLNLGENVQLAMIEKPWGLVKLLTSSTLSVKDIVVRANDFMPSRFPFNELMFLAGDVYNGERKGIYLYGVKISLEWALSLFGEFKGSGLNRIESFACAYDHIREVNKMLALASFRI